MGYILTECREKLGSKYTFISLSGAVLCMLMVVVSTRSNGDGVSLLQYIFTKGDKGEMVFLESLLKNPVAVCLEVAYPLIAGFTTASIYCDKYITKYDRYLIMRSGKRRFAVSQIIGTILMSLCISVVAMAIYYICVLFVSVETISFMTVLQMFSKRVLCLWVLLCFGGMLTLIFAALTANKYISLLMPVYICYVLKMISDRVIRTLDFFDPDFLEKYYLYGMIDPKCLYYYDTVIENAGNSLFIMAYPMMLIVGTTIVAYITITVRRKGF